MKAKVEQLLHTALYRYECPSTFTLSNYQMRQLPEPEQAQVADHVDRCPHCQVELQRLVTFLAPAAAAWHQSKGFIWQQIKDKGLILIRFLQEIVPASPPAPMAVKGHQRETDQVKSIRHIILSPDETEDFDLEAAVRPDPQSSQAYQITVRVQIPSHWPDLSGVMIRATARTWQREELTNDNGEVTFDGLPEEWLDELSLEISRN